MASSPSQGAYRASLISPSGLSSLSHPSPIYWLSLRPSGPVPCPTHPRLMSFCIGIMQGVMNLGFYVHVLAQPDFISSSRKLRTHRPLCADMSFASLLAHAPSIHPIIQSPSFIIFRITALFCERPSQAFVCNSVALSSSSQTIILRTFLSYIFDQAHSFTRFLQLSYCILAFRAPVFHSLIHFLQVLAQCHFYSRTNLNNNPTRLISRCPLELRLPSVARMPPSNNTCGLRVSAC